MNGLEALEKLKNEVVYTDERYGMVTNNDIFSNEIDIIENDLKVLQIITKKDVNLLMIRKYVFFIGEKISIEEFLESYNTIKKDKLTKEELTLLIEYVKGE